MTQRAGQPLVLAGGRVVDRDEVLEDAGVVISGERIVDVFTGPPPAGDVVDVAGRFIAPGLVDLHIHGAAGRSFEEAEDPDAVPAVLRHLASVGVTSVQASLASDRVEVLVGRVRALHAWRDSGVRGGAELLGVHLEGPFLAQAQRGAHSPAVLQAPEPAAVTALAGLAPAMVTLAPELPGAVEAVRAFAAAGTVVAAGHSEARGAHLAAAAGAGLSHLTHLWSGQSTTVREGPWRVPGLLEESLASDALTAEVIADGRHLPPALLEIARRCVGDRLVVVSDATSGAGMPEGHRYRLAEVVCEVRDGVGVVVGADAFGGSTTTLAAMVAYLVRELGWPLVEVLAMATTRPAAVAGVAHRKGRLAPGHDADVLVLDHDLTPWATIVRGAFARRPG